MVRAIKSKQPTRQSFCALRSKRFLRQTPAKRWLLSALSQVLHGSFTRQTSQSPQSSRRNARPTRRHSSSLLEIDSNGGNGFGFEKSPTASTAIISFAAIVPEVLRSFLPLPELSLLCG